MSDYREWPVGELCARLAEVCEGEGLWWDLTYYNGTYTIMIDGQGIEEDGDLQRHPTLADAIDQGFLLIANLLEMVLTITENEGYTLEPL